MKTRYVKYDELFKREVGKYDYNNLPIFPISESETIYKIVKDLRSIIRELGFITITDMYDIIEMHEPSLEAPKRYVDNLYGWTCINDLYVLHMNDGVTIGIQEEPMLLR